MATPISKPGRIRAYFSHSYRPEDKIRNLFFWNLFAEQGLFFTVDRKTPVTVPMHVSYLEWLMRRSACFIAVVPRRSDADTPYNWSRYQVFENGLAVRARKPRLIFVEDGLPGHLFRGTDENEVCFYHPTRYEDQQEEFKAKAEILLEKAAAFVTDIAVPRKPVIVDPSN